LARKKFSELELGSPQLLEYWKYFRNLSIIELKKVYSRLNIEFDEYSGESFYSGDKSNNVIQLFIENNLLKDKDGSKVVECNNGTNVRIIKKDGSSLYITRDIAAAIHRSEEYKFDKMIYVVDNDQRHHLSNLFALLEMLNFPWAKNCQHARFGKIRGLSTRKGNMVMLDGIIDEAVTRMLEAQGKTETTRVQGTEAEKAAEILGLSALIVHDFKQRRVKDYNFSWDTATSSKGDTGVRLQYLHARLHSLIENCGVDVDFEASTELLTEECAINLIHHIGGWDECLCKSYIELEPSVIVKYLFQLCKLTNRCIKELTVKGSPPDIASARVLLFYCSKIILADGLKLIGVQPLDKM